MPAAARNPREADSNFAYYFRESLSVVTNAFLLASADKDERILIYEPPVKLQRKAGDPLYMSITQTYLVTQAEEGYKARTTSYVYSLLTKKDDTFREIVEFHWHPRSTPKLRWPHLHVNGKTDDGDISRVHLPTARVCVEDFLRLLIRDFGVLARLPYDEWKKILAKNKAAFVEHSSWLHYDPLI